MRETIKLGIKTFLRLRERAIERGHELAEAWEDLVEEARAEQAAEATNQPMPAADSGEAPAREATARGKPSAPSAASADEVGSARRRKAAAPRRGAGSPAPEPIAIDKVRLKPEDRPGESPAATTRSRPRRTGRGKTSPEAQ